MASKSIIKAFGGLFILLGTVSCSSGGSSASNQLTTQLVSSQYLLQQVQWESCNQSKYSGISTYYTRLLGTRLSCALIDAPIDYSDEAKGSLKVAVLKVAAEQPQSRKGAIFFNPGGPGGDGLDMPLSYALLWQGANPADEVGAKLKLMSQSYDLIGFSPRGVGSSTNLICDNKTFEQPVNFLSDDRSESNLNNLFANLKLQADACKQSPLASYINTDATARDMDLIRSLLGDSKISYIGYSYGTYLGTWYASLFPDHVDKMVLDSVTDVTSSLPELFTKQPEALQNVLDNIIAPYALEPQNQILKLGSTVEEVRAIFPSLNTNLKDGVSNLLYKFLFSSVRAKDTLEALASAKLVNSIIERNPDATANRLWVLVATYDYGNYGKSSAGVRNNSMLLINNYIANIQGYKRAIKFNGTNFAVKCNDVISPTDHQYWVSLGNDLAKKAHVFGGGVTGYNCTSDWGGPSVTKPDLTQATKVPAILLIQSQFDGATPLAGAQVTNHELTNSSLIYVTRDYSHGVFPYNTRCVDVPVYDYFLEGKKPGKSITCEGKVLFKDQGLFAQGTSDKSLYLASANRNESLSSAYINYESAINLINEIHDEISEAEVIDHSL